MILTAIKAYKGKIIWGVLLSMFAALGVLAWQNWALIQKAAVLAAEKAQIASVNTANKATIEHLQSEIAKHEKASRERAIAQAKIESEYQSTIKQRDAQITQMRRDHEEIDAFLSIPVPDAFVDQWMRGKDNRKDGNDLSENTGASDGSE